VKTYLGRFCLPPKLFLSPTAMNSGVKGFEGGKTKPNIKVVKNFRGRDCC